MSDICDMSRNKMCYIILALSIIFFLSSVCTFAVLAMTKENKVVSVPTQKINKQPHNEQKRILKRLKRIEERMKKRNKKDKQ